MTFFRRKALLFLSSFIIGATFVRAADVVLVYGSEEAVRKGTPTYAVDSSQGIIASAKLALEAKPLFVGRPQESLHRGTLLRLDNQMDVALLGFGEIIDNPELQRAHRTTGEKLIAFIPTASSTSTFVARVETSSGSSVASSAAFAVKINGQPVNDQPVRLSVKRQRSDCVIEITRTDEAPVWNINLKLTSDPKLSFWKKGAERSLNGVPERELNYSQQMVFKPMAKGASISVPVEVYFVKEQTYKWTLNISSKSGSITQTFPVTFESK